ncbi:hypothetical protein OHD16_13420 [Sphingobacterium sp. ML3W]|uniref:hypothetical protein n=1 Tax=Sphingobacterium sp. ML3W TaxID=1538644 RepID=UPI00249BB2E5|nr:hypothetical protein [Sphingobacterium sp. ML3W]WFA80960.1 hypothetical protein OGI71_06565 [Sphingobacterium sp. ML3W]
MILLTSPQKTGVFKKRKFGDELLILKRRKKADESLSMSGADELAVPKKLQEFIKVATGFFQVTD